MLLNKAKRRLQKFLKRNKNLFFLVISILIFTTGVFFRFYNLNWDEGHSFHPDERNIAAAVSRIRFFSQMNPGFFAYGSFPIYLYRATGEILNYFTNNKNWTYDWGKINLIGRGWSAFVSSLTLLVVYKLTKKIFDKKTALVSLFLTSFTVFLIQTAHYGVTESFLAFYIAVIIYLSLNLIEKPSPSQALKLAAVTGLAISTKISALTFLLPPVLGFFYLIFKSFFKKNYNFFWLNIFNFLVFFFFTFIVFFFTSPYILLDFPKFKESMLYEGGIVSGRLIVCYVYQFINTTPYFYWIKNWYFTQGPLLALTSIFGWIYFAYLTFKSKNFRLFLVLIWPVVYFAIVGSWFTKFVRYLVPLYPFLALFSAKVLVDLGNFKKSFRFLTFLVLLTTLLYSFAFMKIYFTPQTRILASDWIYQNIPSGSKILTEHWDDGLPVSTKLGWPSIYNIEQLTIYEPDNQEKVNYYAEKLSSADYIVINSRRLYGTLMYLPEKYPITSRYYRLLFSGRLGYQKVAQFTSYPRIFGIEFNDDGSEESFQVYDHPKVLIFKNEGKYSPELIKSILTGNELEI